MIVEGSERVAELDAAESLYAHVQRRKSEIARQVADVTTIYLDTKYWVWLEKAARGDTSNPDHHKLLELLRKGVSEGKLVCPITDATILELVLRHPPDRQDEPLILVEQLSRLTSILPQQERMELEIERLLGAPTSDDVTLVWVRSSYLFGERHPVPNPDFFDATAQPDIQKRFFERSWDMPISTFLKTNNGIQHDERPDLTNLATQLDQENRAHAADGKSFADFLSIERTGVSQILAYLAEPVVSRLRPNETYQTNLWAIFISRLLDRPIGWRRMPTANILASLHAIRRADSARKVHRNDHHDFEHATAALGYCDAFFCEASLAEAIKSAGLLKEYGCFVTSRIEDALTFTAKHVSARP